MIKTLDLRERFISAVTTMYSTQRNRRAADSSAKGTEALASSIISEEGQDSVGLDKAGRGKREQEMQ